MRNARSNVYLFFAFFWCFVILVRALLGIGYDPESIRITSSNPSVLRRLRLRSQEGIEMGWEHLGKPGLGIWQGVLQKEEAWKDNWVAMAVHALKQRADEIQSAREEEHLDVAQVEKHLMEEDDELLAPAHTYHDQVLSVAGA